MFRSDRLRSLRLERRYTHEQLSEMLGLGVRQIARYESGENDPTADVIGKMVEVFSVSADYLLGVTDERSLRYGIGELSPLEQAAVVAWRNGNKLEAIRVIVGT